jgi:hypothetical protein
MQESQWDTPETRFALAEARAYERLQRFRLQGRMGLGAGLVLLSSQLALLNFDRLATTGFVIGAVAFCVILVGLLVWLGGGLSRIPFWWKRIYANARADMDRPPLTAIRIAGILVGLAVLAYVQLGDPLRGGTHLIVLFGAIAFGLGSWRSRDPTFPVVGAALIAVGFAARVMPGFTEPAAWFAIAVVALLQGTYQAFAPRAWLLRWQRQ